MAKNENWRNFETETHDEVYNGYQKLYDGIDAAAAIAFIIGSALFFSETTKTAATWLFLVGSLFFAVRPMIHLVRDFHMARLPEEGEAEGD